MIMIYIYTFIIFYTLILVSIFILNSILVFINNLFKQFIKDLISDLKLNKALKAIFLKLDFSTFILKNLL